MTRFFAIAILSLATCMDSVRGDPENSPTIRVAVLRDCRSLDEALKIVLEREYQGTIRIIKTKANTYTAINILDIEDYLLNVIGREISPTSPLEALKAQAIAARSHALHEASVSENQSYDLVANISQAYFGREKLHKNVVLAIEATRGQVLYFQGKPIPAFFHSSCGGHTETASNVWQSLILTRSGVPVKFPGAVYCSACAKSEETKWKFEISVATLQRIFQRYGYKVGASPSITIAQKAVGGHAITVAIRSETGEFILSAEKLRSILGYSSLKSTLFQVSRESLPNNTPGDTLLFTGGGYGHGVGLCQYGAQVMAEHGSSCNAILAHYFPDCRVQSHPTDTLVSSR